MQGHAALSNNDEPALSEGRGWSRRAGPGEGLVSYHLSSFNDSSGPAAVAAALPGWTTERRVYGDTRAASIGAADSKVTISGISKRMAVPPPGPLSIWKEKSWP